MRLETDKMQKDKLCPRCKVIKLDPIDVRNALSRKDNKTYICESCGIAEAIEDQFANKN